MTKSVGVEDKVYFKVIEKQFELENKGHRLYLKDLVAKAILNGIDTVEP